MSENIVDGNSTQDTADEAAESRFEPITSQEQLNRIISERIGRERRKYADYDEMRAKAARFDELEKAQKTELEKAQERANRAEAKALEAELRVLRSEIAGKYSIPAELLQGANSEELEKSAAALAAFREETRDSASKNQRGGFNPLLGFPPKESDKTSARNLARALFNRD